MAVPESIASALASIPGITLPGLPANVVCEGSSFHSPQPLRLHTVDLGRGRTVMLCGTCRDKLAVLAALQVHARDDGPWRRCFGHRLRALIPEES